MDYDYESNSPEAELYRLRTKTRELEIEIDTLNTQNVRLAKENSELANDLNLRTTESNTATSINAELRMMLFKAQNERDELNESLQTLKQKYNKLYDKYAVNDRQFRAINQTFRDVNRLGTNLKSDQSRHKFQRPESKLPKSESECDILTLELKKHLDEAYDKIEELEFELESLEVLEHENQQLRSDLNQFEKETSIDSSLPSSPATPSTTNTKPPITPRKSLNMTSPIFNQISTTQLKQQEHSTYSSSSSSSIILRTSATILPSSNRLGTRYSTASTVTPEEIQGNTKSPIQSPIQSPNETPLPPTRSSSKFYVENENIYEPIGEQQTKNVTTTTTNKNDDLTIVNDDYDDDDDDDDDDDNDQSINHNDVHDDENLGDGSDNGSFKRKPILKKQPSFVCGARQTVGGNVNAEESNKMMINLVGELHQFKFKNSSQGPKNA